MRNAGLEKARAGIKIAGRMALKYVKYHIWNESLVQVWCTILDAWGWCTGTTQRMVWGGRRGEGSGWGTHVYLWRIHFDIWQNQYNIVKFKNKIKLKKKNVVTKDETEEADKCQSLVEKTDHGKIFGLYPVAQQFSASLIISTNNLIINPQCRCMNLLNYL